MVRVPLALHILDIHVLYSIAIDRPPDFCSTPIRICVSPAGPAFAFTYLRSLFTGSRHQRNIRGW
jgi:hypothetical protein